MTKLILSLSVLFVVIEFACQSNPAGSTNGDLQLTAKLIGVSRVWLRVQVASNGERRVLNLTRDGSKIFSVQCFGLDTLILSDSLLPIHTYKFIATLTGKNIYSASAVELDITTLDTTSHDFTWQIDSVGGPTSNILYDVGIVNDSLFYAVGQVYGYDSAGNFDPQPYNLVIWNGKSWSLRKLFAGYSVPTIKSVFIFNDHDIWFDPWFHWDGQNFQELPSDPIFFGVGISKMWGDADGIYVAGTGGFIAHRSPPGTWRQISSGTNVDMLDIWGGIDPKSGNKTILAVGSEHQSGNAFCVLEINSIAATLLDTTGLRPQESSVWFCPNGPYYVIGDGVFYKNALPEINWIEIRHLSPYYSERIRGNSSNDVFIAGGFGQILHYNGLTWKNYQDDGDIPYFNGAWLSIATQGNTVVAVGYIGNRAAMLRGVRK